MFECEDSIDRVYPLNFVHAYVESLPRKRFVSKNKVRNKFIEGYNALKNAMDIVMCMNRAPVFDQLPPLCVRMSSMQAVDDLADKVPIWTSQHYQSPY